MIIIKPGASIVGCRKEILIALISLDPVFAAEQVDTVVTSGCEVYKHSANRSGHYRGDAVDLRSKHLPDDSKNPVLEAIQLLLGADFVVLFENVGKSSEHFHIHWSPVFHESA